MDKSIVILIIILLFVLGVFAIIQLGGDGGTTGSVIANANPAQYGGGCGR